MKKSRALTVNLIIWVLSVGLIELFLQLFSYPHWIPREKSNSVKGWCLPDRTMGWKNRPGQWNLADLESGASTTLTYLDDTSRFGGSASEAKSRIVFVGDSYVQGYGLTDEDTFVSILQKQFPNIDFDNFGVPGYGTYQSFLMMREILQTARESPNHIFYLLNSFHEQRNVGDLIELRHLLTIDGLNIP